MEGWRNRGRVPPQRDPLALDRRRCATGYRTVDLLVEWLERESPAIRRGFGEIALLERPAHSQVTARTDSRLYALDKPSFLASVSSHPRAAAGESARPRPALEASDNRPVIDPLERWRKYGEKPDYAGLLTYGGAPYTQDPAELAGFDVAIVGAPTDDLVSDRPGTRFGPRAIRAASCPPGPHLESKVDAFEELKIVDFGDAAVLPADAAASHEAIFELVGQVLDAGALPIVLGGDHSIAEPDVRAVAGHHGPVGLVHFDTHTDTGREVFGVEVSHGTPMFRLVEAGKLAPKRYVQIGLRGYWPGEETFKWQADNGITSFFMHDVRRDGIEAIVARTLELVGEGPVYLTVDVDVLDPAFAPGTGTPEPGGMTSSDLLWAVPHRRATELELVGAEVVEVIPTAVGSADVTALVADRIVREILNGIALRRRASG